jgi:hypothetical protein
MNSSDAEVLTLILNLIWSPIISTISAILNFFIIYAYQEGIRILRLVAKRIFRFAPFVLYVKLLIIYF